MRRASQSAELPWIARSVLRGGAATTVYHVMDKGGRKSRGLSAGQRDTSSAAVDWSVSGLSRI
jgi:hypothetical protein